jgi:hypothetical protein
MRDRRQKRRRAVARGWRYILLIFLVDLIMLTLNLLHGKCDISTPGNGTDTLSRNVSNKPAYAVDQSRRRQISSTSRRKPAAGMAY